MTVPIKRALARFEKADTPEEQIDEPQDEGEGDFGQCFHGSFLKAVAWRGPARRDSLSSFTRNSLHPLHRKRRRVSYKKVFNHGWQGWGTG